MRAATIVSIGAGVLLFLATFAMGGFAGVPRGSASTIGASTRFHTPMARSPGSGTGGAFAFVSTFEDAALDGWTSLSGATPAVTTKTTYFTEPSLRSAANQGPQIDVADQGFVTGQSFVSFQVAMNAAKGTGYFALADASHNPLAVVGVSGGTVWAGPDITHLASVGTVPLNTAFPGDWVYLSANVFDQGSKAPDWVMQLFIDRTDVVAASVSVPNAGSYSEALLETTFGTVYYSDIVVSTNEIPIYVPGYNNMEGYGQGSGGNVELLPAYTTLSAEMTLNSWDTPQVGILSFQINAMNLYGTTRSSCVGFFQLGIDLDPSGTISPWYVPGKNCFAHFFLPSNNPAVQPGVPSPAGTHLVLTIEDDVASAAVIFTIVDTSIDRTWQAAIPYSGTLFYGMYTQLEWQPCCSNFPIEDYHFSGVLYNEQIMTADGHVQPLKADYMLPFTLDAPLAWSLTWYQDKTLGYDQIA